MSSVPSASRIAKIPKIRIYQSSIPIYIELIISRKNNATIVIHPIVRLRTVRTRGDVTSKTKRNETWAIAIARMRLVVMLLK